ncbi:MAG: DUF815 domain-containing protein, partial [Sulfurimonadaceae bacterium]|nr:DUF815 domain-containing protein [Sulfurimonadaceae bacterium]
MQIDFKNHKAAIWRAKKEYLKPVIFIEEIGFHDLIGIEKQKKALRENTERF